MTGRDDQDEWHSGSGETGHPAPGGPGTGCGDWPAHFIRVLSDEDEGSRLKAAGAPGRIGDPGAAWPLRRLYRMENDTVRETVKEAIDAVLQASVKEQGKGLFGGLPARSPSGAAGEVFRL